MVRSLFGGKLVRSTPPHLVMPITVEPSKPRMCHDERFLNCWIKDCPFSLDYIMDLPRYLGDGHYQTTFDDRSGYDHVRLHPWSEATRCLPIAVKEAQALFNTLESLCSDTHNARINAFVDNMALLHSWERQVSKSSAMSDILKDIFSFTLSRNLSLNLMYVPSKDNPADAPSRSLSDLDCSLSPAAWLQVDKAFGPHTIDLMALPFNVQNNRTGCPLRFFSPFPCTQAFGVNVFAQDISSDENAYVFPPFVLIGPLLKYLRSQLCTFSIVIPDLCPRKFWWPLVQRTASSSFKLGSKGDADILLFPAKSGPAMLEPRPLQWDLWVFRIPSAS